MVHLQFFWMISFHGRTSSRSCFLSSRFPHLGVRTFFWTNYAVNPSCLRYWIGLIPPSDIFIRSSAYQCI